MGKHRKEQKLNRSEKISLKTQIQIRIFKIKKTKLYHAFFIEDKCQFGREVPVNLSQPRLRVCQRGEEGNRRSSGPRHAQSTQGAQCAIQPSHGRPSRCSSDL